MEGFTKNIKHALDTVLGQSYEINQIVTDLKAIKGIRKIWIAGNGGSAAIASHFASDLMNLGYDVVCMNDNVSRLTSLINDHGWEHVYTRQMIDGNFNGGSGELFDFFIVFSVHGGKDKNKKRNWSENLVRACTYAKSLNGCVIAFLGGDGGRIKDLADEAMVVPHYSPNVVEGIHSILTHLICEMLQEVNR